MAAPTSHIMNAREIKIFYTRLILVFAFMVGLLSVFQNWELGANDFDITGPKVSRSFWSEVRVLAIGLIYEGKNLLPKLWGYFDWIEKNQLPTFSRMIVTTFFLWLLAPLFLARALSTSRIFWSLWMFTHFSFCVLFVDVYHKYVPYFFGYTIGMRMGVDAHISWLSGFYFGCAALFLHLCAMLLLFFPIRKKPMT